MFAKELLKNERHHVRREGGGEVEVRIARAGEAGHAGAGGEAVADGAADEKALAVRGEAVEEGARRQAADARRRELAIKLGDHARPGAPGTAGG